MDSSFSTGRHEAYYQSIGSQSLKIPATDGNDIETLVKIADKELVKIEVSHKVR